MTDGQKALISDICLDVLGHWEEFHEPITQSMVQNRYCMRLKRHMGPQATMTWLFRQLDQAKVIKTLRKRTGAVYGMPAEIWEQLSEAEQLELRDRIQRMSDPRSEIRWATRRKRQTSTSGV